MVKHRHDFKRFEKGDYGFCSSYKVIECPDCEFLILRYIDDDEDINDAEKKAIKYYRQKDRKSCDALSFWYYSADNWRSKVERIYT